MRKTFKYRLYPTQAQRTRLNTTLETCRQVYNDTLALRKSAWEERQETLSLYDTNRVLTGWKKDNPQLSHVFSQVLQNVQERVDLAFKAFFRRVKVARDQEAGYPRFKGRGRYDSFTFKQPGFGFRFKNDRLFLSKIGEVKIKRHRPIQGVIKTLTIQRDSVGNWYACFSCEVEPKPLPPTDQVVGIDLGLAAFATLSNGSVIERQRWMGHDEKDLKRLQRKVSRLPKGSPERRKAIHALQHAHKRIAHRRSNFAHQASRKLVNQYQFIAFEKLDIQGMQGNGLKTINRGIADVAWAQFVHCTAYKAEEAGRGFAQVNPRGTTQDCSGCGETVPKTLNVRVHTCPHCGLVLNRDHNAALNILARGLASVRLDPVEAPAL